MRVLCITSMYPPHHLGGYELSCRDVMDRLVDRGHAVTVLTSDLERPGATSPADAGRATVRRELQLYLDRTSFEPADAAPLASWRIERANQAVVRRALTEVQPDVISIWQVAALSVGVLTTAIRSGIPIVYAVCDDWLGYATTLDPWSRRLGRLGGTARLLEPLAGVPTVPPDLGTSGAFLFVSDFTRQRALSKARWHLDVHSVVLSGIEGGVFAPPPLEASGTRPWRGRLLYAGRLDPRKGVETAIRAVALVPDAFLEVVGPGDPAYAEQLHELVTDLGLDGRVSFDAVDRAGLADRFRAADAFLFTSEWEEPFGLVPIEAMACATPVIATGTGGSGEFLHDGANCLRYAPGDPQALAAAVTSLAQDPELRTTLVAGGLRTAAELDVDHLADAFDRWHRWAVAPETEPRPTDRVA